MTLPRELLQLANHLANLDEAAPSQASRRRAVSAAFESWDAIKNEPAAQAFLFSLLAKDR
jgi:hypothetical protein